MGRILCIAITSKRANKLATHHLIAKNLANIIGKILAVPFIYQSIYLSKPQIFHVICINTITKAQVEEIAKTKMPDLNAATIESAMSMVEGTCRSMGVTVTE